MKKLKILFFIVSLLMAVLLVWVFSVNQVKYSNNRIKSNDFKIIEISGLGIFYKNNLIDKENIQDIKLIEKDKIRKFPVYIDNNTSFKFKFYDYLFTVLPDSFLKFDNTKIIFLKGEVYWEKIIPKKKNSIKGNKIIVKNLYKMSLSDEGRCVISEKSAIFWNYKGRLTFADGNSYTLKDGEYLSVNFADEPVIASFIKSPLILRPENNFIISKEKDTIVQFQWNDMEDSGKNNTAYIIRFYSSKTMGKLKEEQISGVNDVFNSERRTDSLNLPVDFSALSESNTVYWRIFPYDKSNNIEGRPSEIRKLQIANYLLNNKSSQVPPFLQIDPPMVSGNIVIFSGKADPKSRLFVDGKEYEITEDGVFNFNISFEKEGIYTIVFELVSPSYRKNKQKKIVRIQ